MESNGKRCHVFLLLQLVQLHSYKGLAKLHDAQFFAYMIQSAAFSAIIV